MSMFQDVNMLSTSAMMAEANPGRPGSPNYQGSVDTPDSVYKGYPGSYNYVWEPRATGFNILDKISSEQIQSPVANKLDNNKTDLERNQI